MALKLRALGDTGKVAMDKRGLGAFEDVLPGFTGLGLLQRLYPVPGEQALDSAGVDGIFDRGFDIARRANAHPRIRDGLERPPREWMA